jgi:antitoxin (DNA-binding transcriptional repressor) of toxin-antitoxin stability system
MNPIQVEVQGLPARFTELLALAAAGTEVIVTAGGIPRARLLPLQAGPEGFQDCTRAPCRRPTISTRRCRRSSGRAAPVRRDARSQAVWIVFSWFNYASNQMPELMKKYYGREQDVEPGVSGTSFPLLPVRDR